MSIESVMPSNHLILCRPLLLLPPIPLSIRVFSNESALHMRWLKYWSISFSISPSNEYSGLISFKMDWLDLLAVQGTLKSFLQHHSSKTSILLPLSFLYSPTLTSIHDYCLCFTIIHELWILWTFWPASEDFLWKKWEYQTTWPASWETYMQIRKKQLELDMKQ